MGQTIPITFTVTSTGGTPTGNVTVSDGTASCVGTVAAGGCNLIPTTAGAKNLTATYAGDANFAGSASGIVAHAVTAAATTTAITGDAPDPSVVGQPYTVNYSVAVTAPGTGTPTGDVTVSDGTATCAGTVAAGSCVLTSTTVGAKNLTANYAGDANFTGSSSAAVPHQVDAFGAVSASLSTVTASAPTITASPGSSQSTITVTARDAFGNVIPSASIIFSSTGTANSFTPPTESTNGAGVATSAFNSTNAEPKTISATANGVLIEQTASVTVDPAAASQLAFTVQPSNTTQNATITPAVQVTVQDEFGNTVTGSTAAITLTITPGTGTLGATLSGGGPVSASGGGATFSTLRIDLPNLPGLGYRLDATATGLTTATSNLFDITAL